MSTIVAVFDLGSTSAQYDQVIRDLEAAGAGEPKARLYHEDACRTSLPLTTGGGWS
jgi:hypothetical protein